MPRQVKTALCAQANGNLRDGTIASDKSGGLDGNVRESPLKHGLEIRTSTDVTVANDQDFPRPIATRKELAHLPMTTAVQHPVRQVPSSVIGRLHNLPRPGVPSVLNRHVAAAKTRGAGPNEHSHSVSRARSDETCECVGTVNKLSRNRIDPLPAFAPEPGASGAGVSSSVMGCHERLRARCAESASPCIDQGKTEKARVTTNYRAHGGDIGEFT